jgi:hypothetical protein
MAKTQSETSFEKFCANLGISCKRISEEHGKTPDYELTIDERKIIVEVKEITPNDEERESGRLLDERGYGNVLSNTPGDRPLPFNHMKSLSNDKKRGGIEKL